MKFTPEDRGDQGGKSSELQLLATTADGEGTVLVSDGGSETGVVKKAVIINKNGSLTVVKKSAPTAEGESASYTLEGYTDLKLDDGMITSLVNNGNGMAAKSIVARDCDDTAKYGFDKPHATVEFTYESGNKAKFIVGDTAPSTESIYVMIDGDNNVYAVEPSNVAVYMRELKNFVDTTVLEKPDDDSEPDVKNVEVERGDMESSIYIESGEEFAREILAGRMRAVHVCCGEDFRFGKMASCGAVELKSFGERFGFEVEIVGEVDIGGSAVSSSRIRALLLKGDIISANSLLGSDYFISVEVSDGNHIGRTMNFPTINQKFENGQLVPKYGVYSTITYADGQEYCSITNVGVKPTINGERSPLAETHIIGYSGDLYGKTVTVSFRDFVRPERKFDSLDELKKQINADIESVMNIF